MEVSPSETECADPRNPAVVDPERGPGLKCERTRFRIIVSVWRFQVNGRRLDPVIHRQCSLHEARKARSAFGMSDLRFDRA